MSPDGIRAFLAAPPPPPVEAVRKFLRTFFSDANSIEEVRTRISTRLRENPRPILAGLQGLAALMSSQADRRHLGKLVAWDANWVLDQPDNDGAASWFTSVSELVAQCQSQNVTILPGSPSPSGNVSKSIEGRIFGDLPWCRRVNYSYKWQSDAVMNDTVNGHIQRNWNEIRMHLSVNGIFEATFDTTQPVGEGYVNANAGIAGPPKAVHSTTQHVRLILGMRPPPEGFYVIAALPCATGAF